MAFMEARRGRDKQLYEGIYRLVSGCVPYRFLQQVTDEASCLQGRIEVLMVSTPNRTDLVFPKGGWEGDESVEEAACREALEEAGVRGILHKTPLGVWKFRSKSMQARCTPEGGCKGYMFPLEVTEELEIWPEMESHGRRWVSIEEAFQLCRYDWMREALSAFVNLMVKENNITIQKAVDGPASVSTPVEYKLPSEKGIFSMRWGFLKLLHLHPAARGITSLASELCAICTTKLHHETWKL